METASKRILVILIGLQAPKKRFFIRGFLGGRDGR